MIKLVAADTVDEDIYDMGERKRQLSTAVLSDDRANSSKTSNRKGGHANNGDDDEDIGAIGRILQRALQRISVV